MLPNGSNAPSLTQDCPAGADKRRWGLADGLCCAGPAARARVGRARVGRARVGRGANKRRWGIAGNDKGTTVGQLPGEACCR